VLDPDKHARLIAQRAEIARDANIPMHLLWAPAKDKLTEKELTWVRDFHKHKAKGYCGLSLLVGSFKSDPLGRKAGTRRG
jgi:hypothetical protein